MGNRICDDKNDAEHRKTRRPPRYVTNARSCILTLELTATLISPIRSNLIDRVRSTLSGLGLTKGAKTITFHSDRLGKIADFGIPLTWSKHCNVFRNGGGGGAQRKPHFVNGFFDTYLPSDLSSICQFNWEPTDGFLGYKCQLILED